MKEDTTMADTLTILKTRRSCRAYKPDHIEEEKLSAILEAGTYAATGMGKQSPIILVVRNQEIRNTLAKLNAAAMGMEIDPFYGAPELVVVLANKAMPTYIYDGSLVMGNMMNAAADLGVASCWVHRAKEEFESEEGKAILKELGVEGDYEGIGNLILGYAEKPAGAAAPRKTDYIYTI
jgi:nitroreductase